jgi:DNA-binding beta-propeller fold protein YncE
VKTIETGYKPDFAISPDGRRLYMAAIRGSDPTAWEDDLTAFDATTWQAVWKTQIEHAAGANGRAVYIDIGPSALAISPDGSRLFIFQYAGHDDWFTVMDTATGKTIAKSEHMAYCDGADLQFSHDGQWLYLSCYGSNDIHVMNAKTLQIEGTLNIPGAPFSDYPGVPPYAKIGGVPGSMIGTVVSPDGKWVYVVTDEPRLALVNLEKRNIERWVDLGRQSYPASHDGMVALSADGNRLFVGVRTQGADSNVDGIRVFDTQSWQQITELSLASLHLDGNLRLLSASRINNQLMLGLETSFLENNYLRHRSSFLVLDWTRPSVAALPKIDLGESESLVRIVIAP